MTTSVPVDPAPPPRARLLELKPGYALPFLVLIIGLIITHQLWQDAQHNAVGELKTRFDNLVHDASDRVVQRIATYEKVLRGVNGLFDHSSNVSRVEFHDYVANLRLEGGTHPTINHF